jgi:hypothetical protein
VWSYISTPQYAFKARYSVDLREVGSESVDWMHLSHDRDQLQALVNTVMNLRFPQKAGNFLTS